ALFWLFLDKAWIAALLVWWLTPLLGRFALHALAKATFGERTTVRSGLTDLRGIFRRGAVAGLLWRRLSLQRSFTLPLWQLEGQDGPGFRRRAPVLLRRAQGASHLFTIVSFLLMLCFALAIGAMLLYLVPKGLIEHAGSRLFSDGDRPGPLVYALPALASAVLEPFYIAGGFGLYLNRRVQLEAWDLDLAFRQLAQRLRAGLGRAVATLLIASALLCGPHLRAQAPAKNPKAELKEVLKAPEFQTWSEQRRWHWKDTGKRGDTRRPPVIPEGFFKAVGLVLKWSIIVAAAGGVLWFLWRFLLVPRSGWSRDEDRLAPPEDLFGLDIRPGSLPKDVAGAALALWKAGERRASLSLLYRGALARLVHERGLEVSMGATEGDCLRAAAPVLGEDAGGYFRALTSAWQALAYAHQEPGDGEGLCVEWRRHFGGGRG
ncbi:MAG TPA: DUF4129 domain-containing protein, partial [Holophagaceae bacterium]|nr:DUF4129 domain-containing protein [Holophagaceae bacterium]